MQDNLIIISVNMNCQLDALITMLKTTDTSILLIQEPSWGCLVLKKSDDDPEGVEVKGTCSHPRWWTILPTTSKGDLVPHVAIFLRSDLTNSLTYSILPDMNSYACLGIRLNTDTPLFIINFYHHVLHPRTILGRFISFCLPLFPSNLYYTFYLVLSASIRF